MCTMNPNLTSGQRLMAESQHMGVEVKVAADKLDRLEAHNAKLRELMRDTYDCICEMYRYMDGRYAYEDAEADDAYGPILKRMRELGIETKQ